MSAKTIYTCDHCGKPVEFGQKTLHLATFNYAVYDMPDLHACSKEHLGLALAKAFDLPMDNNTLRLVTEKNDALNAASAAIIERDKAQADIAELGNTVQQWATKCQDLDRQLTNALLASRPANSCTDAERKQFEITIEQKNERIEALEKHLAELTTPLAIDGKTLGQVAYAEYACLMGINPDLAECGVITATCWERAAQAVLRTHGQTLAKQDAASALRQIRARLKDRAEGVEEPLAFYYHLAPIIDAEIASLEAPKPASDHIHELGSCTHCDKQGDAEPRGITIPTKPTKPLAVACDNCGGTGLALVAGDNTAECAKCRGKGYL